MTLTTWPATITCGLCGHTAATNTEASAILAGLGCSSHSPALVCANCGRDDDRVFRHGQSLLCADCIVNG